MPRCRFQLDQWAQWIQDYSVSNLSVADFCANHHLPVHSFYFWRRKLASHFKPIKRKNLADARLAENALQFIPLQLRGVTPEVTVDLPSGLVLHIPTDPMILQPVLQVLIQLGASRQS
jgi:hypothetical protein